MKLVVRDRSRTCLTISGIIVAVALLLSIFGWGMNLGIDFTGGILLKYEMGQAFDVSDITAALQAQGYTEAPQIAKAGEEQTEAQVRIKDVENSDDMRTAMEADLQLKYPSMSFLSVDRVGAVAGRDLVFNAIKSVLLASALMLLYIAIRFDLYSGVAAVFGLIHDVAVMCSFMVILRPFVQVNSTFIAACLTIVGYSINNTIVIFDRIRENARKPGLRTQPRAQIASVSVQESLNRTINTTATTLMTVVAIYILGVDSIREFALTLDHRHALRRLLLQHDQRLRLGLADGSWQIAQTSREEGVSANKDRAFPDRKGFFLFITQIYNKRRRQGVLRFIPRSDAQDATPLTQSGIPEPLALLMVQRGVHTPEAARAFLAPHPDQLLDPMRLKDMDHAVRALRQAIQRQERITIYGDYDVDGVTATALLHETLEACGACVAYYIPSRHEEGYGLHREALERLRETTDLLVTVDCGITAADDVAYAYSLGMRVIVTDHHEAPECLPACEAVVNPLLGEYPFPKLCGAGVAFKLAQALRGWEAVLPLLPLVALATVADLVPLLEENRVLTALGLQAMQTDQRPGLRALIEVAGLEGKPITAGHLGFQIGPRLNAGGRLKHAAQNVALLLTRDMGEAREIAQALNAENTLRQRLEQKTFEAADAWVSQNVDFLSERALVVVGEGWNHGVIGLAASRLVEKYHYPTVVLCREGDQCVGSARSISGIHIHRALSSCAALFTRFGGHSQAAGMTLPNVAVPEFRRLLNEAVRVQEGPDTFLPTERYDAVLTLDTLTIPLLRQLDALAPHGMGNPAPTFCLQGAQVLTARAVGQDQSHLRMRLAQGGAQADAIAFRQAGLLEQLPERLDALIRPSLNTWQGRSELSCQIEKLQPHAPEQTFVQQCKKDRIRFERAILARMAYNKDLNTSAPGTCPFAGTALDPTGNVAEHAMAGRAAGSRNLGSDGIYGGSLACQGAGATVGVLPGRSGRRARFSRPVRGAKPCGFENALSTDCVPGRRSGGAGCAFCTRRVSGRKPFWPTGTPATGLTSRLRGSRQATGRCARYTGRYAISRARAAG